MAVGVGWRVEEFFFAPPFFPFVSCLGVACRDPVGRAFPVFPLGFCIPIGDFGAWPVLLIGLFVLWLWLISLLQYTFFLMTSINNEE